MYRLILPLLLCACAVRSAPQERDNNKPQPTASDQPAGGTGPEASLGGVAAGAPESGETVRRARQGSATAGPEEAGTEPALTETEAVTAPRTSARSFTRAPRPTSPTRPSARFISKLSYFNGANAASDGPETNLLERGYNYKGYRKFTSSCRCEKIWNCPRLQVTTPRCPDEYFLCCDL